MSFALGIIETGHVAAIAAADAAAKAADIRILDITNSKFDGCFTLKIDGDVGAVKAAVEAGAKAAEKIGHVHFAGVIPRIADGIEMIVGCAKGDDSEAEDCAMPESEETVSEEEPEEETIAPEAEPEEVSVVPEAEEEQGAVVPETEPEETESAIAVELIGDSDTQKNKKTYTCNICKDPRCGRKKGNKHTLCIHCRDGGGYEV